MLIALLLSLAHASCPASLDVLSKTTQRAGVATRVFEFTETPKRRVRLEATVEMRSLGALGEYGVRRFTEAARALGWRGPVRPLKHRSLPIVTLHFVPPGPIPTDHERLDLLDRQVRERHASDLGERAALLAQLADAFGDREVVYRFNLADEPVQWRDYEEVLKTGRAPTQAWIAGQMRLKAIAVGGQPPPDVGLAGVTRYPFQVVRQNDWAPTLLLLQRSR